ncbi:MAG: hypothetical protein CMP23_02875 [Rickettsiales bacterium]|nr:hypothetical protein [Rickettsiales bacterium]
MLLACALGLLPLIMGGCESDSCLKGEDGCVVAPPCEALHFECSDDLTLLQARLVTVDDPAVPGGMDALAAVGDILLSNGRVSAVIDALEHPHYLAPSGGNLLDLGSPGGGDDSLRGIFHATGLLPGDAALYTRYRILDEPGVAAVQFEGHLDGHPEYRVNTRYEIRPCDPGVRVRTEFINAGTEAQSWMGADGFYYGKREHLPFTASPGAGFNHPSFGLTTVPDAIASTPYLAIAAHTEPASSYGVVACNLAEASGFHSTEVSAMGIPLTLVMPRDYLVYERFITVSPGASVSGAVDLSLEVREQLWGEAWVSVGGQLLASDDPGSQLGRDVRAAVLISEGTLQTPMDERIPRSHVLTDASGLFSARLPASRDYVLSVQAFGDTVHEQELSVGQDSIDLGSLELPPVGALMLDGRIDGESDHILALIHPADDATAAAVSGAIFGQFETCAPLLGNPNGPSPACNRVLLDGPVELPILPGNYDIYAIAGPFSSLAHQRVEITAGQTSSAVLELQSIELQPHGSLSADLHVHGRASFDSSIPDLDRVAAFLAARVDVIASTDHDVVNNYAAAMEALDAWERIHLIDGLETTGHILFRLQPEFPFPQVTGHWNFWPVPFDPEGPWRGATWDEKVEPGQLFTRMQDFTGWDADTGIVQLNHPLGDLQFGRDLGYASALGIATNVDLPTSFDGTAPSMFLYQPPGADFANSDYHSQEVMNGTNNGDFLLFRAFWFYLLNQGILRAGTANSDSHGLTDNVLGTPRNLIWTDTSLLDFDLEIFNQAIRDGRILGTNGPILELSTQAADGSRRTPSIIPFTPASDATLRIDLKAAPWVPIEEVRIIVNGELVRSIADKLAPAGDPMGQAASTRLEGLEIPLSELLPASGDAWLVVEAGQPLPPNADLNCDGLPDTGDNNADGTIDWQDVEVLEDLQEAPETTCLDDTGPLQLPEPPTDRSSPEYLFHSVVPGGYPLAFSNPLIFDRDGNGFSGVSR